MRVAVSRAARRETPPGPCLPRGGRWHPPIPRKADAGRGSLLVGTFPPIPLSAFGHFPQGGREGTRLLNYRFSIIFR